jgi:hypothetical protein
MGLKQPIYRVMRTLLIAILAVLSLSSCSSTSWVVVDEKAMDINDYKLISSQYFLESSNGITPNQPLVHFDLKAIKTYEYAQRVRTERYIQRYRPRLSYVLLGAAGAGLSTYAAFSDQLLSQPSDPQRYALIGAGTVLTGLSLLNMKPVGEPAKTGETRLLRKTGNIQQADTIFARPYNTNKPSIKISYQGEVLAEQENWAFSKGQIIVNITDEVDAGVFEENPKAKLVVEARYDTLSYAREVAVKDVFEQFVVVNAQITALRNEPENNRKNVLTDLAQGSQLKLVSKEGDWYKVLYGISETWVSAGDVKTIWRPSEFASDLSVIAIPNIPFGSVDVERNIPVLGKSTLNSSAFIVSNNQYEGELSERIYGQRDAKLMEEYFIQAFGIRGTNIIKTSNVSSDKLLERAYSRLANSMSGSRQNLSVYINGYAEVRDSKVYLIGTELKDGKVQYIALNKFFRALSKLNVNSIFIFADLDILNARGTEKPLKDLASIITDEHKNAGVFFASRIAQRSGIYSSASGEQKRHSIFSYYLADAIKQRKVKLSDIQNYLDRNVPFTSRSLYDRPQHPLFYGNGELELLN